MGRVILRPLFFTMLVWFVVRFISDLVSGSTETIIVTFHYWTNQGMFFFITAAIASSTRGEEKIKSLLVFSSIVLISVSLYELVTNEPFMGQFREVFNTGLSDDLLSSKMTAKLREGSFRIQSLMGHPIVLAQFLAGVLPLFVLLSFETRGVKRLALYAIILVGLWTIIETQSRAGLLAMIVTIATGISFYILRASRKHRLLIIIAGIFIVFCSTILLQGFFSEVISGRTKEESMSTLARDAMWDRSAPYLATGLLFGHGDSRAVELGGYFDEINGVYTIDDGLLSTILDFGIVGLAAFGAFCVTLMILLFRATFTCPAGLASLYIGFFTLCLSILIVQKIISLTDNIAFLYVAAGFLCGAAAKNQTIQRSPFGRVTSPQRFTGR